MVPRPVGLIERFVDITFNGAEFSVLEIDLNHINKGKKGNRLNTLTIEQITNIAVSFLHEDIMEPQGKKEFGEVYCDFFMKENFYRNKKYRLVFCFCSDYPDRLGIITLYRI